MLNFLQLALIIAQTRGEGGRLSGIRLEALGTGLQKVAMEAKKRGGNQWVNGDHRRNVSFSVISLKRGGVEGRDSMIGVGTIWLRGPHNFFMLFRPN